MRAALLQPVRRNETYSAAKRYADALAIELVPALRRPRESQRRAWARASAPWRCCMRTASHPTLFGGLFLQSGSFFRRELDGYERTFPRFERIARFVGGVDGARGWQHPVPVTMTCGLGEENLGNNRAMRDALAAQSYPVELVEHRDAHNWVSWRDVLDPHLTSSWSACGCEKGDPARGRRADRLRPLRPAAARVPVRAGPGLAVRGARDDRVDRSPC